MVEKKKTTIKPEPAKTEGTKDETAKTPQSSYTMNEVFKITDDLFTLSKEREYPLGAFIHGLIFTLEFASQSYRIPPQQLAEIKRDCRRYVDEIVRSNALRTTEQKKK
ncbi:MAG TPA: hypothetical protein VN377_05620 [Candidatus Thermoplasmatota archaeon]|nr:hypothetical protein [Candidatus Thermoplasmatota archaeon]